MIYRDELRIVAEMQTFTQSDLAEACQFSNQYASMVFDQLVRAKLIYRVRVGKSWLYALTERGKAAVARMPAIDENERCLPLSFEGVAPEPGFYQRCCEVWDMGHIVYEQFEPGSMVGSWTCCGCGKLHPVAVYNPH